MGMARRILGVVFLLFSTIGIVGCIAAIVGLWMGHQIIREKVTTITERLDDGLQRAYLPTQSVQRALEQARASLDSVNRESASLRGSEKNLAVSSVLRKLVRQQVGPNINELGVRLATLSAVATAVTSLLQSFQELPLSQNDRFPSDKLDDWTDQATQLSATLRRLEGIVGPTNQQCSREEMAAASQGVQLALQRCQAKVDKWQRLLETASEQLPNVRTVFFRWLTLATIALTALCVWVGLGQISLLAHALTWCRRG
jgi:hypothetical protein